MSSVEGLPIIQYFADISGKSLDDGFVYIGTSGLDPVTNPISVFWDAALTIPAPNPIRTRNGHPDQSGVPSRFFVDADSYSFAVKNKNGTTVYSALDSLSATDIERRIRNDTDPAKGASLVGFKVPATGSTSESLAACARRYVEAEKFGWPTVEAGASMNAAIAYAVSIGAREVHFSVPHYNQTTPIVLQNGIVIVGPGCGPEGEIRVAAGVAIDAQIQTPDFETTYAAKPGSVLNGVIRDAGFKRLFLNGNKANVPAVSDWRKGMGARCYWIRPVVEDVRIHSTPGIGGFSSYPANGRTFPPGYNFAANLNIDVKDRFINGLYINDTDYEGFVFEGPSDLPVKDVFVGWPAGTLQSATFNAAKQSLKFTSGGLVAIQVTAGGTGYTTAPVTIGGVGSGATATAVISGGAITKIIINTEGYDYVRGSTTVTIGGDGTGATAVAYIDDRIDGIVFNNDGAELGFIHSFNNAQGWAVNFRNDSAGFPRIKGDFVMGETSWGNVRMGGHSRYQIARVDTHLGGHGGGPAVLPSLQITSDRGGTFGTWEEFRDASTANGAPAGYMSGTNNHIYGGAIFGRGQNGDGLVINGKQNTARFACFGVVGAALVTEQGISAGQIALNGSENSLAWRNEVTSSSLTSVIDIDNTAIGASSQYSGLNSLSTAQWKNIRISNLRSDTTSFSHSSQAVFGTADATLTSEQTIVINHAVVRTPQLSDCVVQIKPNAGATVHPIDYMYVSATAAGNITVKVKFSAVGVGTASIQVNIG